MHQHREAKLLLLPQKLGETEARLTQDADPVVQRDDDDIAVAGQNAAVDHVPCALHVRAAVYVDHHGFGTGVSDVCKSGHR